MNIANIASRTALAADYQITLVKGTRVTHDTIIIIIYFVPPSFRGVIMTFRR
ncbi:hypothetical protein DPMN_077655 [Dreissena polymorpha]|uniref:Uncharacterized protein n=1 Tax=Dreissena polymorpha TaxID=45954 RepID=A0A9D4BGU3_DREPO|nr:hypothetical protein DPMN_077655 [Dreissena polymorpha]